MSEEEQMRLAMQLSIANGEVKKTPVPDPIPVKTLENSKKLALRYLNGLFDYKDTDTELNLALKESMKTYEDEIMIRNLVSYLFLF